MYSGKAARKPWVSSWKDFQHLLVVKTKMRIVNGVRVVLLVRIGRGMVGVIVRKVVRGVVLSKAILDLNR